MDAIANQGRSLNITDNLGEDCQRAFRLFLEKFKEGSKFKYVELAEKMTNLEKLSLGVSFNDLMEYNNPLSKHIMISFYRLYPFLCKATKKFINEQFPDTDNNGRDYMCHFVDFPTLTSLRNLKTSNLGKLSRFRAQVIRSHAVHPELINGTFKCSDCGTIIKSVEQEFIHTKPTICVNSQCLNRLKFELVLEESKFVDFQKVRVQETQDELPRGCVPRSLDVILRCDTVETAQPGDMSEFIGTLIVIPDISQMATPGSRTLETKPIKQTEGYERGVTGLKCLGVRDLTYRMAFLAVNVATVNNKYMDSEDLRDGGELTYDSLMKKLTQEEIDQVLRMSQDTNLVTNLCSSLFPTVYGNDEVKLGLLLMLFGGVPKVTEEGTKLRGDINICLVGDPSTAKSQFLKKIASFAPRAVYTSGKASTAAGLTAAVVRDQESGEFVIEAGALMLANNGICCIDEFDKMDIRDQVAIHEAMEQQTISITKAGIKATLNARTSVLAAANPIGGRYDRSRSLRQNISLSAPIMSRFDLFFVLVDECNEQVDYEIARRILKSQSATITTDTDAIYSEEDIRRYITFSRCFEPKISEDALKLMTVEYKKMRDRDAMSGSQSAWRITVRQLESLIRLSEARAKLRFSDYVEEIDVIEANRLLNKSIIRVEQPDINLSAEFFPTTTTTNGHIVTPLVNGDSRNDDDDEDSHGGVKTSHEKQTITFEEYNKISNVIISYLRHMEAENEEIQIKKSELVEWYLGSIVDTISDEEVLMNKKHVVELIIQRLITKDNVLMAVYHTGLQGSDVSSDDPFISLHPNVPLM